MKRTVIVDVETTGLSVQRGGRVIEVGAVALENGIQAEIFSKLIYTGTPVSYGAYLVHGISDKMLAGQPKPEEVWQSFRQFVQDSTLVAHNAPFDSAFIRNELSLQGIELCNSWQCTLRMARRHLPNLANHKLDTVYKHFFNSISSSAKRHRALDDAILTAGIFNELSKFAR